MWVNVWPKMIVMCTYTPAIACSINITFLPLACSYLKTHSEDFVLFFLTEFLKKNINPFREFEFKLKS